MKQYQLTSAMMDYKYNKIFNDHVRRWYQKRLVPLDAKQLLPHVNYTVNMCSEMKHNVQLTPPKLEHFDMMTC